MLIIASLDGLIINQSFFSLGGKGSLIDEYLKYTCRASFNG
ncbi:hypothetical protein F3D3_1747 [Fusibacter sp. 3D3]|nr:hypothetical protein F3D3_1747 [Fusibacter sp. 3D3]